MTAALFSEYISGNQSAENLSFEELKTLVVQYPYCRQLHNLLAQKEALSKSQSGQSNTLVMASSMAPNRMSFFNFIRKKKASSLKRP